MRLDCARDIRENREGDWLARRFFELTTEVRVVSAIGADALAARAKSPNCKAGDGTAELREVLAGKGTLPEPLLSSGSIGRGRLSAVIDGYLNLPREMFMGNRAPASIFNLA